MRNVGRKQCLQRLTSLFVFSHLYINYTMSEMLRNIEPLIKIRQRSWVTPTPPAVQSESYHLDENSLDLLTGLNLTVPQEH